MSHESIPVYLLLAPLPPNDRGALAPKRHNGAFNVRVATVVKLCLSLQGPYRRPSACVTVPETSAEKSKASITGEVNREEWEQSAQIFADDSAKFRQTLEFAETLRGDSRNQLLPFDFSLWAGLQNRDAEVLARLSERNSEDFLLPLLYTDTRCKPPRDNFPLRGSRRVFRLYHQFPRNVQINSLNEALACSSCAGCHQQHAAPITYVVFAGQILAKKGQILFLYMTSGSFGNKHFWQHAM